MYRCKGRSRSARTVFEGNLGRADRRDRWFCTLRRPLHRRSLCAGGHGRGARAPSGFVPQRNKHHRGDCNCCVDDGGESPRGCSAVPNGEHQIAQRHEAHRERTDADERRRGDRSVVNPARCAGTDGERDAVHGGQQFGMAAVVSTMMLSCRGSGFGLRYGQPLNAARTELGAQQMPPLSHLAKRDGLTAIGGGRRLGL